jgi:hypothetical protein
LTHNAPESAVKPKDRKKMGTELPLPHSYRGVLHILGRRKAYKVELKSVCA